MDPVHAAVTEREMEMEMEVEKRALGHNIERELLGEDIHINRERAKSARKRLR